jgi:hypothetical protein
MNYDGVGFSALQFPASRLFMDKIIEKILNYEIAVKLLEKASQLSPAETKTVVAIIAILIAYLAYKRFGIKILMALCMLYLILYILYINNFISVFSANQQEKELQLKELQAELEK